ncbi:hypothetical protein HYALB_00013217 [Hymenoscyphus albidus]|uniref:Ankyrin n=1 Tax=Hymenoscyphus albidus TaxID=595503 RepID=A0A9N9Q8M6_9HELO|nr:hypothetical protein HYALB_00013217 [Hymenoscyphus albidus]
MTGIPAEIVRLEAKVETLYQQSVRKGRASVATLRVAKFRPTLHEAVAKGDEEEVSRMVANGADVNAQIPSLDVSEDYSIRMATGKNWQEIPLSLSVLNRHENIFRILLDINPSRKSLLWAFHACIRTENCVLADELIKRGVDVNEIDTERGNCYPLEIAAAGNHKEILELLLRRGAITEPSSNPMEGSPLMIAAGQGHANSVRLLLENGAAINHEGGIYGTALGAASFHGKEGVAKSLLEKGANPNIRSKYYGTSLARARFWNRPGIEAVLMQYGATE